MRGWSDYFFMVGSSALALIGLMFVVVTLTAGRDRHELEAGKKLYTTPIVWHLGVVVVLSAGAVAPILASNWTGIGVLLLGLLGMTYAFSITVGIRRAQLASNFSGYDAFWYGVAPGVIYAVIGLSGLAMFRQATFGPSAIAAAVMALLLVSIHNEWDLVTYLAPDAPGPGKGAGSETE
ncbi:MAG TPA: hypothetical protein VGU01_03925 [Sphingomicrobium sp.]|nr:hypothetical protein [Sphingomicrobium sp.]